jgi:hypothetical protein
MRNATAKRNKEEWFRKKVSEGLKGKKFSEERKRNISEGLKEYHRRKNETNNNFID